MKIKVKDLKRIVNEEIEKKVNEKSTKKIKMKVNELKSMIGRILRENSDHLDYYIDLHNQAKYHKGQPLGPYKMNDVIELIEKFEADGDVPLEDYRILETDPSGFQRDVTKEFSATSRLGKGVSAEDEEEMSDLM